MRGGMDSRAVNNRAGQEQVSGNEPREGSPSPPGSPMWVPKALPSPVTRSASTVPWTLSPASQDAPSSQQ